MDEPMEDRDELAVLAALRPDPTPTSETVDRHRAALRSAMATANRDESTAGTYSVGAGMDFVDPAIHANDPVTVDLAGLDHRRDGPSTHGSRARRRWARIGAVAALAVAVVGTGFLVVQAGDRDGSVTITPGAPGEAGESTQGAPPAAEIPADDHDLCGALPIGIPVPEGYSGPQPGPSPTAVTSPAAGQYVLHWTSPTGSIELRWPSTERILDPSSPPPEGVPLTAAASVEAVEKAPGVWQSELEIQSTTLGPESCSVVELLVQDSTAERANDDLASLYHGLFAPGTPLGGPVVPLVIESTPADVVPDPVLCEGGTVPEAPNQSGDGPVGDPTDTAVAALELVLASAAFAPEPSPEDVDSVIPVEPRPLTGFRELTLPDGSIAYGMPLIDNPQEYGVVIHVAETAEGWAVVGWERAGC